MENIIGVTDITMNRNDGMTLDWIEGNTELPVDLLNS